MQHPSGKIHNTLDQVTATSKESAQTNKDKKVKVTNNQEIDVPNIGKSSSLEVYKSSYLILGVPKFCFFKGSQ